MPGKKEKQRRGPDASTKNYVRMRRVRLALWLLFIAAIPLAIVLKVEYSAERAVRLLPFVFLGGALATGFAERRVRLRHSLPEQSLDFRNR